MANTETAAQLDLDKQWIFDLAAEHESKGSGLYGPVTFDATGLFNFSEALIAQARAQPAAARPTDDDLWDATLRDRDAYHDWADKLADAIAAYFGVDIGEHSNQNLPWAEALEAIEAAADAGSQTLVILTLGGIDGDEYDDNDIEIESSVRLEELQRELVRTSEPVVLELVARTYAAPIALSVNSGEGAPNVKTWQERQDEDNEQWTASVYMLREIADLRAQLAAAPAAPHAQAEPVAWRCRGYNHQKKGHNTEWIITADRSRVEFYKNHGAIVEPLCLPSAPQEVDQSSDEGG